MKNPSQVAVALTNTHIHTDSPSSPKKVTAKLRLPQNDKKNNYGHGFPENQLRDVQIWPLALFLFGFFLKCGRKRTILFFERDWGRGDRGVCFLVMGSTPLFLYWGQYPPQEWFFYGLTRAMHLFLFNVASLFIREGSRTPQKIS